MLKCFRYLYNIPEIDVRITKAQHEEYLRKYNIGKYQLFVHSLMSFSFIYIGFIFSSFVSCLVISIPLPLSLSLSLHSQIPIHCIDPLKYKSFNNNILYDLFDDDMWMLLGDD